MNDFLDNLLSDGSSIIDTTAAFGAGAIASGISGNPLYSQDPAAAGYAVNQTKAQTSLPGSNNLIFLVVIGYVILKLAK